MVGLYGYCADISRAFVESHKFSSEQKKIYQANCVCNTKVTYNKSNRKFSNQGAVSNRSRINRLKYNTRVIKNQKIENKNDRFK